MSNATVYLGLNEQGMIAYEGDRHVLMLGPNGSGKTTRFLAQNLVLFPKRSAVVIDPKGELAAMTAQHRRKHGRVVVLNPFNLLVDQLPDLASARFNPLAALDPNSPEFPDDATGVAEAIVKVEGREPHWSASAQDLMAALCMHVRREMGELAGIGSLTEVRRMLCEPSTWNDEGVPIKGLAHTALMMQASGYAPIAAKGGRFMGQSREIDGIVSTAMTQSRFLDSLPLQADLTGNGVNFSDLKRETLTVYVIIPANRLRTHAGWLRLVIETALKSIYATPNQPREPVMMIVDEAAALGYMAALEDAAGIARGYQAQLIVCLQDLNQIQALYERRWQTFIANAGALIAFAPRDHFTAKYLSDLSGHRTQLVRSMSSGSSQQGAHGSSSSNESFNIAPQAVPRYRPEELMAMRRGNAILFTDFLENCAMIPTPEYMAIPEVVRHIRPNPYYAVPQP